MIETAYMTLAGDIFTIETTKHFGKIIHLDKYIKGKWQGFKINNTCFIHEEIRKLIDESIYLGEL